MDPSPTWGTPTSFRLTQLAQNAYDLPIRTFANTHQSHPSLGHLCLLVFEAVLEVVCVSLPGYIIARLGHFDADKQKFLANLNVMLFTPCLSMLVPTIVQKQSLTVNYRSFHEIGFSAQR